MPWWSSGSSSSSTGTTGGTTATNPQYTAIQATLNTISGNASTSVTKLNDLSRLLSPTYLNDLSGNIRAILTKLNSQSAGTPSGSAPVTTSSSASSTQVITPTFITNLFNDYMSYLYSYINDVCDIPAIETAFTGLDAKIYGYPPSVELSYLTGVIKGITPVITRVQNTRDNYIAQGKRIIQNMEILLQNIFTQQSVRDYLTAAGSKVSPPVSLDKFIELITGIVKASLGPLYSIITLNTMFTFSYPEKSSLPLIMAYRTPLTFGDIYKQLIGSSSYSFTWMALLELSKQLPTTGGGWRPKNHLRRHTHRRKVTKKPRRATR